MSPYRETVKATDEDARARAEHAYDVASRAVDDAVAVSIRVSSVEERVDHLVRSVNIYFWTFFVSLILLLFAVLALQTIVSRLRLDIAVDATTVETDEAERERARRTTLEQDRALCARVCGLCTYVASECEWDHGGVRECECSCYNPHRGLVNQDVREQR